MEKESLKTEIKDILYKEMQSNKIYDWLDSIGYFEAPASVCYHGAYPGGLGEHSLMVALRLKDLTEKLNLRWSRPASPILVGLLHDVCKADQYKLLKDNSLYGTYEYKRADCSVFSHHAEKSISMLLCGGIELTEEEVVCIRWHMGAYETDKNEWDYLNRAIKKYNNVLWTHVADMIASQIDNI